MSEILMVGDIPVEVTRKKVKNVHLTVHPPEGEVRITAPERMALETLRLFAISKLAWIRSQRREFKGQERETEREYLDRESHYVWGRRRLLKIEEADAAPRVECRPNELVLFVRPGSDEARREEILSAWHRERVRAAAAPLLDQWTGRLGVQTGRVFVQHMKTRWGSCNPETAAIRLNTELGKKPPECLEYVIVHELLHLIEPTHSPRFIALLDQSLADWRRRRDLLNSLPLRHEEWEY
jgi:predicted metal-dependent hydrolase